MGTYNVSKIEGWLKDFTSAKDKFTNTYYSDYKNSYIRSCNDSAVVKMRNKLNEHYARISRINSRVKNVWDDFLWDLKVIDNRLAGGKGSANDSSVGSKLAKLPSLKEYKANLSVRINSASAVVGTVDKIGWSEDKNFWENLDNSMDVIESTAAVTATSVISGIYGLAEDLVDGALWLSTAAVTGAATLFGAEEWANNAQNTMMDAISYDVVGEANKAFYENTSLGRTINERSIIKYDSEVAQSIQNASTKVTEFAAATALTIATGGAAAPVAALIIGGTGFLIGAGDKAQENFQQEDRNFWGDSKEVAIAGAVKAVEFYSEGQMGAGALKAIGTIKSAGGVKNLLSNMKTVLSNGESSLFTKESLKNGLKATLKDTDTYMDSIGAAFNNITYDNKNGIQVNWKGLAKETACNFALNSVFGFVGNSFEAKMTSGMKNLGIDVKSPDVNSNSMKNTIEGVNPKNIEVSTNPTKSDINLDSLRKEYDELLNKSKESWFVKAKEASDNGWAWDLNKVSEADNIVKRMQELESTLGVKNTGVPESKIYDYSQAKKEADAMVQKMRNEPIPALEKYKVDTNSEEYQKALKEYYSKPSPSGKQDLSSFTVLLGDNNSEFSRAIKILDAQGGEGYGRKALEHYSKTGTVVQMQNGKQSYYITNKGGVRDYISSLDPQTVRRYLDNEIDNELRRILPILDAQGGKGYGRKALEHYSKTGTVVQIQNGKQSYYITSNGGARDFIAGLDPETVQRFLKNMDNNASLDIMHQRAFDTFKNSDFISNNFSEKQMNDALVAHTYATEEEFLKAYGHNWDGTLKGFNRGNEVHINPEYDSEHTRIHEGLHNLTSVFDSDGKKVVTGFEWFSKVHAGDYSNGDVIFNEGATDYLTHKLVGDGCESGDYFVSFKFFEGLDSIFQTKYGNNNIIFDAYKNHDVTPIKNFVNKYGGNGTFDEISTMMFVSRDKCNEVLDRIRIGVNKELNPSVNQKISNKLKKIFGG